MKINPYFVAATVWALAVAGLFFFGWTRTAIVLSSFGVGVIIGFFWFFVYNWR